MPVCNTTLTEQRIDEEPIFNNVRFHHIGLVVSAVFGLIATVIAVWLMFKHASHYSKPSEQRQIIRILFMIPIYATVSFLSYLFYRHAIYFEVLRDSYEAFAIANFFALLCHYLAPTLHEQKDYFRALTPRNWLLPLNWIQKCTGGKEKGPFRVPRSGLTWFNIIWIGVFQYCFIRVLFTAISVTTQATGRYCESSLHPAFAHIWVMVFEALSVTVAMYCLIQFYVQLKTPLATHRPGFKILCIKLVIFFSFWQTLVISFLVSSGTMRPSNKIQYPDIKVGIPAMAICIEMAIFATLHIWAFSWKEYDISRKVDPLSDSPGYEPPRYLGKGKAFLDAFNPWDVVKATARGFKWLFIGAKNRHNDVSYQNPTEMEQGTAYNGPTFAGNGAPAVVTEGQETGYVTEFKPAGAARGYAPVGHPGHNARHDDDDESDSSTLLGHAQTNPYTNTVPGPYNIAPTNVYSSNPYNNPTNPDALPSHTTHQQNAPPTQPPPAQGTVGRKYSWETQTQIASPANEWAGMSSVNTRPAATQPQGGPPSPSEYSQQTISPQAARPGHGQGRQWDMFGGATNAPPRQGFRDV